MIAVASEVAGMKDPEASDGSFLTDNTATTTTTTTTTTATYYYYYYYY